jgi:predicted HicB family RNase H-like nuclease
MANLKSRNSEKLAAGLTERLADEAEAGYDLSQAKRRRRGRPSLGSSGVSPRIQIRLDPDLAGDLRACAEKQNRSLSEIARVALREYVDKI